MWNRPWRQRAGKSQRNRPRIEWADSEESKERSAAAGIGTHCARRDLCFRPVESELHGERFESDGSRVLPNIPANFGQVKARATCVQNGVTTFGESAFFAVPANGAVNLPDITLGNTTLIPVSLAVTQTAPSLTAAGKT